MMNFKPINLLPARERVAAEIRKAILSNKYVKDDILTLDDISKQLCVSVTPVREAFQLLNNDGLIKLRPNKGAVVLGINEKYIDDHFELRLILESEMLKKICSDKTIDISEIIDVYKEAELQVSKGIISDYSNLNQAFHMAIWKAANNDRIFNILSSLWNGLSMGTNTTELEYAQNSIKEHKAIVEALIKRDQNKAYELMSHHIARSKQDMLTHIK